jgi:hypothetical protein
MAFADPEIDWPQDPRAIALLAAIRIDPPPCEARAQVRALTRDDWHEYVGRRVDLLVAIRDAYGERALDRSFAGDREPMRRWIAAGSVHDVIDEALATSEDQVGAHPKVVPSLACDRVGLPGLQLQSCRHDRQVEG